MLKIVLVHPGATDLDDQGRIKGALDIPLNSNGTDQVRRTAAELSDLNLDMIYCSPCQSSEQTAATLADGRRVRVKELDKLRNLDHGLWQGKRIEEGKQYQPKVYRQWQDNPDQVCPPGGETFSAAKIRLREALVKLLKKHKSGVIALVVPEPLASMVRSMLSHDELGDLWKSECDHGGWELLNIEPRMALL